MDELIYQGSYMEFKEELKGELRKSAESFVKIGYLLKVARDTDILKTSGYSGLEDFARGEFDLDKTQVSRFIRINDRFSENGNSDRLMAGYADFGVRKLGLMLTLPDEINEELSPNYTVGEIQSIKETYDEEQAITPLEEFIEQEQAKEEQNKAAGIARTNMLEAILYEIGHETPELFIQMYTSENLSGETDLFSVLAPGGESTHKVRIKGTGALLMVCNDKAVNITNIRSMEKEEHTWEEVNKAFDDLLIFNMAVDMCPKSAWAKMYDEEFPAKEEVAPAQQKKKPSKVVDHTKKEPKPQKNTLAETVLEAPKTSVTDISKINTTEEFKEAVKSAQVMAAAVEEPIMNPPVDEREAADNENEEADNEKEESDNTVDENGEYNRERVIEFIESSRRKATWEIRDLNEILSHKASHQDIVNAQSKVNRIKMFIESILAGHEEIEKNEKVIGEKF